MRPWLQHIRARFLRYYSRRWRLNTAAFALALAYASGGGLLNASVQPADGENDGNSHLRRASSLSQELVQVGQARQAVGVELNAIDELFARTIDTASQTLPDHFGDQLREIRLELEASARSSYALHQAEALLLADAWGRSNGSEPAALHHSSGSRSYLGMVRSAEFSTLPRGEVELALAARAHRALGVTNSWLVSDRGWTVWREDQRSGLHLHSIRNGAIGGDAFASAHVRLLPAARISTVSHSSLSFLSSASFASEFGDFV